MFKVIECKTSHSNHYKNIGDVPQNIVIISREKEAIKANKYLLSLFSPLGDSIVACCAMRLHVGACTLCMLACGCLLYVCECMYTCGCMHVMHGSYP